MPKNYIGKAFEIMLKIDKTIMYSKEYEKWLSELETDGKPHPDYDKAYRKYYNDVKLELLRCQGGLCAYTEMKLCGTESFLPDQWKNGRCRTKKKIEAFGELDHFDPTLKKEKGWLWANLFVVSGHINKTVKGDKSVDYILKPDADGYALLDKMLFDVDSNMFAPNPLKTPTEKKRIQKMIETLGINYEPVRSIRDDFIKRLKKIIECEAYDPDDYQNSEFPTALSFILEETNTQN